jgi:hypothetical protein
LYGWLTSGSRIARLPKTLIGVLALLVFVEVGATICGLSMLYLPRFTGFLVLICLTVPFTVVVLTPLLLVVQVIWPFLKKVNEQIWLTAILLSGLLAVVSVFLGFFDTSGPIGIQGSIRSRLLSADAQFPISNPSGFAVDRQGRVYLALPAYSRIQVYDSNGHFLKSWFVITAGGVFDIWIEEDLLHAVTARPNSHDVFNLDGQLLTRTHIASFNEDDRLSKKAGGLKELNISGNTYSIRSPRWSPKVLKTAVDGHQVTAIQDPLHLWILQEMQPLLFLTLAGIVLTAILWLIIKFNVDFPQTTAAPATHDRKTT